MKTNITLKGNISRELKPKQVSSTIDALDKRLKIFSRTSVIIRIHSTIKNM